MADQTYQDGELMGARDVRIEIVPFPDADDSIAAPPPPRSGLRPAVPVPDDAADMADGAEVDDIEPVAPETDEVFEPETDAESDLDESEPVASAVEPEPDTDIDFEPDDSEGHGEVEGDGEPEVVDMMEPEEIEADAEATAVEAPQRRRPESAVRPLATPVAETAVDDHRLRNSSISGRLLLLTLGSVLLAALITVTSIWGVARVSGQSRDIAAIGNAEQLNLAALAEARRLGDADDADVPAGVERYVSLASQADEGSRRWVPRELSNQAQSASAAFAQAQADGVAVAVQDETQRDAQSSRLAVTDQLAAQQADAIDDSESLRTRAITLVIVLFALGSILLVAVGRMIGRSISLPLRMLGRSLRRFGDGDLTARAAIAPDEVGTLARSFNVMADSVSERVQQLNAAAERDSQLRMVSDALDLAESESDVYRILDRALGILTPANPAELLVNEPTSSRLWRVSTNPVAGAANCPVETAEGCPAMRRAQAVVFDNPTAINACSKLLDHPDACSAACIPVGVNGHLLGVIHVTAPEDEPPDPKLVEQLVTLAGQVGVRVGAMRTLETTRIEASTDGLTGLSNRRMLEARLGDLLRGQVSFALAVADLDHFKQLNDTYGHETGDRALQLFSKVLEDNVRGHDVVARFGGEEFVLVYPELSVKKSMEVIERIRLALEQAIEANGLPPFTCSFGVTHSSVAATVEAIIRTADAGLFMAKDLGRDRVVYADEELASEVFGQHRAAGGRGLTVLDEDSTDDIETDDIETDDDDGSDGEPVVDLRFADDPVTRS